MQWFCKYLFVLQLFTNIVCHTYVLSFPLFIFIILEKQRIDSGYYLFEAEKKKKQEKKDKKQAQSVTKKSQKWLMGFPDKDFVWTIFVYFDECIL